MKLNKRIDSEIDKMLDRKWDCIYFLIDIHGTIFKPSYYKKETFEWYYYAKETLQLLSRIKEFKLILWTSSHEDKIKQYLQIFEDNNIHFDFVNENPEVRTDAIGDFSKKPYFNIVIDDKCGFYSEDGDWRDLFIHVHDLFAKHKLTD